MGAGPGLLMVSPLASLSKSVRISNTYTPPAGEQKVFVDLPSSLPSGNYLLRVEQIALHAAGTLHGAQFYLGCGQVSVSGGGNGNPGPKVAFPGAYEQDAPGILINLYGDHPDKYPFPGPPVWQG